MLPNMLQAPWVLQDYVNGSHAAAKMSHVQKNKPIGDAFSGPACDRGSNVQFQGGGCRS